VFIPTPITLACAALVIIWGGYRIRLGLRSEEAEAKARERRGLVGLPRRTHLLIGIVYVLLGAGLIAVTFGWNPLAPITDQPEPASTKDTVIEVE
jgi:hypothetical protein